MGNRSKPIKIFELKAKLLLHLGDLLRKSAVLRFSVWTLQVYKPFNHVCKPIKIFFVEKRWWSAAACLCLAAVMFYVVNYPAAVGASIPPQ